MTSPLWAQCLANFTPETGIVGADVTRLPFISGFGLVTRILRLNHFTRADLFKVFGIRAFADLDLLTTTMNARRAASSLSASLNLADGRVPRYWSAAAWSPIAVGDAWDEVTWTPRLCPSCALHGYHCALFQMPWVTRCPWHGDALIDRCHQCVRPIAATLSIGRSLLQCPCGHDLMSTRRATLGIRSFPTESAAQFLGDYLAWAESEAGTRRLFGSQTDPEWLNGLSALIDPPKWVSDRVGMSDAKSHRWRRREACTPAATGDAEVEPWLDILDGHRVQLARLPTELYAPLRHVGRNVVRKCPANSLTRNEWLAFGVSPPTASRPPHVGNPSEFTLLPVGVRKGVGAWIYLTAVTQEAVLLCTRLVAHLQGLLESESQDDSARAVARALMRAVQQLIYRGYCHGLRTILAREIPDLFNVRGAQPIDWVPVCALRVEPKGDVAVEIAWTKRPKAKDPNVGVPKLQAKR